jgi:hypothetical protein
MPDVPRYDRDNLPSGPWVEYRKVGTTRMVAITGPVTVETKEGEYPLPDGWQGFVALDTEGYPYPVDRAVHSRSYELA